jgi:hypothetical protein
MSVTDALLHQDVADRIVARWLTRQGKVDVQLTGGLVGLGGRSVDITYSWQGDRRRIKVKADSYFGTDPAKVRDRTLTFYRQDSFAYAFEAVANTATREPGWMFNSSADEIYYYYLAIAQPEADVRALMGEPDEVFFTELAVERDELVVMPMAVTREWFEANFERYTPRPVMNAGASAWYRLVPREDLERAVPEVRRVGPIFVGLDF